MTQDLGGRSGFDAAPAAPAVPDVATERDDEINDSVGDEDGTVFREIVGSAPRNAPVQVLKSPGSSLTRDDAQPADDFGAIRPANPKAGPEPRAHDPAAERSGSRLLLLFALVVVLAVAVIIGVLATHKPSTHHAPATHQAAPRVPRTESVGHSLPGTIGLGTWHGSGNDVISPPAQQVDPGRELALTVLCNGPGPVTVGPVVNTDCSGSVTGAVDSGTALRLQVTAPDATSWQFDLVDQPQSGTDGALVELPNPALKASSTQALGMHQGSGSADVSLSRPGAPGQALVDVRIVVTCSGDGLTISSTDGSVANQYTRTCFSGWSYEFDATSVRLPTTLHVTADRQTSWHLVAVPF